MQFNEFEYHFACRLKVVHLCFIMSPGKMIFAVLELWLSALQRVLNKVFNIYPKYGLAHYGLGEFVWYKLPSSSSYIIIIVISFFFFIVLFSLFYLVFKYGLLSEINLIDWLIDWLIMASAVDSLKSVHITGKVRQSEVAPKVILSLSLHMMMKSESVWHLHCHPLGRRVSTGSNAVPEWFQWVQVDWFCIVLHQWIYEVAQFNSKEHKEPPLTKSISLVCNYASLWWFPNTLKHIGKLAVYRCCRASTLLTVRFLTVKAF